MTLWPSIYTWGCFNFYPFCMVLLLQIYRCGKISIHLFLLRQGLQIWTCRTRGPKRHGVEWEYQWWEIKKTKAVAGTSRSCIISWLMPSKLIKKHSILLFTEAGRARSAELGQTVLAKTIQNAQTQLSLELITTALTPPRHWLSPDRHGHGHSTKSYLYSFNRASEKVLGPSGSSWVPPFYFLRLYPNTSETMISLNQQIPPNIIKRVTNTNNMRLILNEWRRMLMGLNPCRLCNTLWPAPKGNWMWDEFDLSQ